MQVKAQEAPVQRSQELIRRTDDYPGFALAGKQGDGAADEISSEAGRPPACDSLAIKEAISNRRRHRSHGGAPASRLLFTPSVLHVQNRL